MIVSSNGAKRRYMDVVRALTNHVGTCAQRMR